MLIIGKVVVLSFNTEFRILASNLAKIHSIQFNVLLY